jgi:hypothetical protein
MEDLSRYRHRDPCFESHDAEPDSYREENDADRQKIATEAMKRLPQENEQPIEGKRFAVRRQGVPAETGLLVNSLMLLQSLQPMRRPHCVTRTSIAVTCS